MDPEPPAYESTQEHLPAYTTSIHQCGRLLVKKELTSPWAATYDRRWYLVHARLQGTRLHLFNSQMKLSYGLQYADIGRALDYTRRSNVLRLRAEGTQILLACSSETSMIEWYEQLVAAIAISLPLERRKEPKAAFSCPRRQSTPTKSFYSRVYLYWREEWRRAARASRWNDDVLSDRCLEEHFASDSRTTTQSSTDEPVKDTAEQSNRATCAQDCIRQLLYTDRWRHKVFVNNGIEQSLDEAARLRAWASENAWI